MFRRRGLIAWLVLALCACGASAALRSAVARPCCVSQSAAREGHGHAKGTNPTTAIFVDNVNFVTAYPIGSKGGVAPIALTTDMILPGGIARDAGGRIYVTNTPTNTITIYAADSTGNVRPLAVIGGSLTQLASPTGIALDGSGKIHVLNSGTTAITVYPPLNSGTGILNEAPIAAIAGAKTLLNSPAAIAVDADGNIYIANQAGGPAVPGESFAPGVITVYPAGSNGNIEPTATIVGAATGLVNPESLALDANGDIYVGNLGASFSQSLSYPPSITHYQAGSSGNATPIAVISGSHTGLDHPQGLAVDSSGKIYATSVTTSGNAINLFPAGSNGDVSPSATIVGADTGLSTPNGIAIDSNDNLYISNETGGPIGNGQVTVYSAGSNGDASPSDTISSSFTGIHASQGIAVGSTGKIYVTNQVGGANSLGSIGIYAAGSYATGPPVATIAGDNTGLHFPSSIALDANDNISVLNSNNTITTYHTGSVGDVAPRQTLNIDRSGNNAPAGIAVSPGGAIYVANTGIGSCVLQEGCRESTLGSIAIYQAGSRGNANPAAIISGPDTNLVLPTAIAVSGRGNIFVTNQGVTCVSRSGCFPGGKGSITVYAPHSGGNAKPIATIRGRHTGLAFPGAIAVDANENIYVLTSGPCGGGVGGIFFLPGVLLCQENTTSRAMGDVAKAGDNFVLPGQLDFGPPPGPLLVFKAGSNGNARPIAVIGGPFTPIEGFAIAIGPAGP